MSPGEENGEFSSPGDASPCSEGIEAFYLPEYSQYPVMHCYLIFLAMTHGFKLKQKNYKTHYSQTQFHAFFS